MPGVRQLTLETHFIHVGGRLCPTAHLLFKPLFHPYPDAALI